GSDSSYDSFQDNVTLNVSFGGNSRVVILAPAENASDLGYQGTLHSGGFIRFWNSSAGGNSAEEIDAIFADMDKDGVASTGDVRLGGWRKINPAGQVSKGSVDIGVNLTEFNIAENKVKIIDRNASVESYESGDGTKSSREPIVISRDGVLDSGDEIVRSGKMDLVSFSVKSPERRFVDVNGDGLFDGFEAIVKNDGSDPALLEDLDTVIEPGNASLTNLSSETRFVETGNSPGFEVGSPEAIVWDDGTDGVFETGFLNQSPDQVLRSGEANLMNMKQPPGSNQGSGLLFVDKNSTGRYNTGEDILKVEFITNGSVSERINGTRIFNFAKSTKHNTSGGYRNSSAVVNDTDMNNVFEDVFEGVEIENRMDKASNTPDFLENVSNNEIDNGDLVLYRDVDGDAEKDASDVKVSDIQFQGPSLPYTWNTTSFSQGIVADTSYLAVFNASASLGSDNAYGFKAKVTGIQNQGSESIVSHVNSEIQVIDSHAPEITDVWTGNTSAGNSLASSRDRIYVETNEMYKGVNYETVEVRDFSLYTLDNEPVPGYSIEGIESRDSNNFEIRLNDTFGTGRKFSLYLDGTIRDLGSANSRDSGNNNGPYTVMDGLRPRVVDVLYQDADVNGTIDLLKVVFSENISEYSYEAGDWSVEARNLTGLQVEGARNRTGNVLPLNASAEAGITGVGNLSGEPLINYSGLGTEISDGEGNYLANVTDFRLTDDAGPLIWDGATKDQDNDARPDRLILNFTEAVYDNASVLENSSFSVISPSTGRVEAVGSDRVNDSILKVNISDLGDTSVNPTLRMLNDTIFDPHGNAINSSQDFTSFVENSNPVLVGASVGVFNSTSSTTYVRLRFSENVTENATAADVSLAGKPLNFSSSQEGSIRLVNYGELLRTGNHPNITSINSGVTDDSGNSAALMENSRVEVDTFRKQIFEGWNMVSFPIADESNPRIEDLINTSKVNAIWSYRNGEWQSYDPQAPVNDFNRVEGGVGYLLNASEDFMLEPNVNTVWRGSNQGGKAFDRADAPINAGGWSLLGQFQEYAQMADGTSDLRNGKVGPAFGDPVIGTGNTTNIGAVYRQKWYYDSLLRPGQPIRDLDTEKIKNSTGKAQWYMIPGQAYWAKIDLVKSWTWTP
ncbi:MAG: hypothetical protein ABEK10_02205, partial [Candidatus Nanosalina sp.]